MSRLTFNGGTYPLWTSDGKRIVFGSFREEKPGIYRKSADGTGEEERLSSGQSQVGLIPYSLSKDGKTLLLMEMTGMARQGQYSIDTMSVEGDHSVKPLIKEK